MSATNFPSLAEFIPALSPRWVSPLHLQPLLDLFERHMRGESIRAVVACPPRHSKTESLLHGVAWALVQDPAMQICYASYAARLAEKKSRRCRELARKAGVPLSADAASRQDWRTTVEEGGLWATSVSGQVTGEGFHLALLDDLVSGRSSAESAITRDKIHDWLTSDLLTRIEPGGSVILCGTRWHPNDPSGEMIAAGWESVNLQALDDNDQPLWPERWPQSELFKIRDALGGADSLNWQSLYQGNPRGRGDRVFGDANFYEAKPDLSNAKISIGIDLAYSTKSHSDWSVAVVLAKVGDQLFVLDVVRVRVEPRDFRDRLRLLAKTYPSATFSSYVAGTELAGIEFLRDAGLNIRATQAKQDKYSRAIPTAAAFNSGRILLPQKASWLEDFLSEICSYTGVRDRHDDQLDSLVSAVDSLLADDAPVATYQPPIGISGHSFEQTPIGLDGGGFFGGYEDSVSRFARDSGWIQQSTPLGW